MSRKKMRNAPRIGDYRKWILLIPILYGVIQVAVFGVNVTHGDEWELVKLYDDIQANGLTFGKFFAQHNEHRIFFPRIILLISAVLTHWNVKIQMYISQFMIAAAYGTCLRVCRGVEKREGFQQNGRACWISIVIKLTIGFCCFSAVQWENFLWGFQVGFILVACMAYLSFFFFQKAVQSDSRRDLILCIICGIIASFSSLQGLAVWPVLICTAGLLSIAADRKYWKKLIPILIFGIGAICVYLHGFSFVEGHAGLRANSIWTVIGSICTYIGSMACSSSYVPVAFAFGLMVILISAALSIYIIAAKKLKENIFAINLILFGYAVIAMVAIGRAGSQVVIAESRYLTFAVMPYVGILLIAYGTDFTPQTAVQTTGRQVLWGVLVGVFACVTMANFSAIGTCELVGEGRLVNKEILANYRDCSLPALRRLYLPWSSYEDADKVISVLERNHFSVFSDRDNFAFGEVTDPTVGLRPTEGAQTYCIDLVNGMPPKDTVQISGGGLHLSGWALDDVSKCSPVAVYLKIGEKYYRMRQTERMDVFEYFGGYNGEPLCGFDNWIPLDDVPPGDHPVSLIIVCSGGTSYYATPDFLTACVTDQERKG